MIYIYNTQKTRYPAMKKLKSISIIFICVIISLLLNSCTKTAELPEPESTSKLSYITTQAKDKTKITGTVLDAAGVPLWGANISVIGTPRGAMADENGEFIIFIEEPGQYQIKSSFPGYVTAIEDSVLAHGDHIPIINFTLEENFIDLGPCPCIPATPPLVRQDTSCTQRWFTNVGRGQLMWDPYH